MTTPYYIAQLPVVDTTAPTSALAADAMAFVREAGIEPWAPASQSVVLSPMHQRHVRAGEGFLGQLATDVPSDLPAPQPWRTVHGSFLLDATSWATDTSANWMRRMLSGGGAA